MNISTCITLLAIHLAHDYPHPAHDYPHPAHEYPPRTRLLICLNTEFTPKCRKISGGLLGRGENRKGFRVREALKPQRHAAFSFWWGAYKKGLRLYQNQSPYMVRVTGLEPARLPTRS